MKLQTLIVDDEYNGRQNLQMMIEEYTPDLDIIGVAESGQEALKMFEELEPQVLFLDIKMPGMNGFEFLQHLPHRNFHLVFTTAHNDFGIKAIKENAIDYLEKPISIEDLEIAVQRILKREKANSKQDISKYLDHIIQNSGSKNEKISVPTRDGYAILDPQNIIHLEANESYTIFYLDTGEKHMSSKNIRVYENMLDENVFFRTHKSHIINYLHHLKGYERKDGNVALMSDNSRIPISRRKMNAFIETVLS